MQKGKIIGLPVREEHDTYFIKLVNKQHARIKRQRDIRRAEVRRRVYMAGMTAVAWVVVFLCLTLR